MGSNMKLDQHIIRINDKWAVKGEGNNRVTSFHDNENEAIETGNKISKILGSSLFIHRKMGKFFFRQK